MNSNVVLNHTNDKLFQVEIQHTSLEYEDLHVKN